MNFWTRLVCTWKCFLNIHCQPCSRLSFFVPVRHCICFTVKLDLKTWSPPALKTAGQRCQWKQTRCRPVHVQAEFNLDWSLIYRCGFHPENEDSRPRCLFCNIYSVFHTMFSSLFSSLQWHPCNGIMSWVSVYLSVHSYVWMIVLCLFIWIVFYTLPQHLSGQLSVFL